MAGTAIRRQQPVDYFSASKQRPQSTVSISPSFAWDSSPYSDSALISSDSCDSVLPSPTSPEAIIYPSNAYALPRDTISPEVKPDQAFNFGSFEDWMRWDDPSDAALSPTSDFFPELKVEPMSPNMRDLDIQGNGVASDDAAVFGDDNIDEVPLFQTPSQLISPPLTELPPREGLYSTPLSWSRPAPGSRRSMSYNSVLSPQEESKLRDIAMPSQSQNQDQYPASPSSTSSPEPNTDNRRKRKSSVEDDDEDDSPPPTSNGRHPPVKKTAHNMIEKRYRTNLNDKIAALRDSVPSLRVMSKKNGRGEEYQEDLQGLTPAHKLNKATVLSKATEYIAHLEKRNKYLQKENSSLKSRVDAFEILVMARQSPGGAKPQQQQQQQQRNSMSQRQVNPRGYGMDGMM